MCVFGGPLKQTLLEKRYLSSVYVLSDYELIRSDKNSVHSCGASLYTMMCADIINTTMSYRCSSVMTVDVHLLRL